jgi:hypothetical protein
MLLGQQLGSYLPSAHGNHWDTTLAAAPSVRLAVPVGARTHGDARGGDPDR